MAEGVLKMGRGVMMVLGLMLVVFEGGSCVVVDEEEGALSGRAEGDEDWDEESVLVTMDGCESKEEVVVEERVLLEEDESAANPPRPWPWPAIEGTKVARKKRRGIEKELETILTGLVFRIATLAVLRRGDTTVNAMREHTIYCNT
jgi:hypothetical protein